MYKRLRALPIWLRILGAFTVAMIFATGEMLYWGIRQQQRLGLEQAAAAAAASIHMAYTALGVAMGTGDSKEILAVIDELQKSQSIKGLRVVPAEGVKQQFNITAAAAPDPLEQSVLQDRQPRFGVEDHAGALVYRAVMPIAAARDFVGRDCTSCHQVGEGAVLGAVSLEIGLDQLQQANADFRRAILVSGAAVGAIFLVAFYFLCRRIIARPLDEVVCQLKDMSQGNGDLTRRLTVHSQDEIGELAEWFNLFLNKIQATVRSIADTVQSLAGSAEELTAVSHQMSSNSDETATQANVVSAASEQVSQNVQTVAAGAEQMSASIKEIAKNTSDAALVAREAVAVAEETNQTISKLGDSSAEIGNVIKVITSIAEQTNLLALNAAIEAARAGEAGKGFAVVANEVKELAKQTGHATEEIGQKISAIQHDAQGAVAAIGRIGAIINQINDIANTIASAVEEQTVTTNEMARNVEEAAKGSNNIVQNITGVAQAAQSTASGATQTQAAAQELALLATELQTTIGQFRYQPARAPEPSAKTRPPKTREFVESRPANTTLHTL